MYNNLFCYVLQQSMTNYKLKTIIDSNYADEKSEI